MSAATRVTTTLILLSLASAMIAHIAIDVPNAAEREYQRWTLTGESLAFRCAPLAQSGNQQQLERCLARFGQRHPEVRSVEVHGEQAELLAQWSNPAPWAPGASAQPPQTQQLSFPLMHHDQPWGTLRVDFAKAGWLKSLLGEPAFLATVITFALNGLFFLWFIGRVLNLFDPLSAITQQVSSTVNSFSEGLVLLDDAGRIVLANVAFADMLGADHKDLVGRRIDEFDWQSDQDQGAMPWHNRHQEDSNPSHRLVLHAPNGSCHQLLVRKAPVPDEARARVGAIVCFDDITAIEEKRDSLRKMLAELQSSRDELTLRNQELQVLATRDPLTACLNRRTFFELFDQYWQAARRVNEPLGCVMVDIDYFKSINDNHGHRMGDDVLRAVAQLLQTCGPENQTLCRYGGEEFCILAPSMDIQQAERLGEQIRAAITRLEFDDLKITASIGVSSTTLAAVDPQALIDQADKCLYVAKRNGRNQVVRWDEVPENVGRLGNHSDLNAGENSIPYAAVASLMSALAYRHPDTAAHSTRVAELAVITARGLMSAKDAYVLEIGALLHDIGKIGMPDSILFKPGPLTGDETELMRIRNRIGVEIIETSFANPQLVNILRYHHAWFGGYPTSPSKLQGKQLPLAARIVAIADAYDAMVSNLVYRRARGQREAFAELRRCAGTQFDPELVERFIEVVEEHKSLALPVGSKYNALQIGLQIERLSKAVDERDRVGILASASQLEATAAHCNIHEIRAVAAELRQAAACGDDVQEMIKMTHQLIDLCRSTQRAYVDIDLWDAADVQRELLAFS
jgi:diguanylate cyclase (GGDEF)-like protein/PAS domain S-box-containing protein